MLFGKQKIIMSKNPVIQKARDEGYKEGFAAGAKQGHEHEKYSACMLFAKRFEDLKKIPGVGPKTFEKIVKCFGEEYFENEKN